MSHDYKKNLYFYENYFHAGKEPTMDRRPSGPYRQPFVGSDERRSAGCRRRVGAGRSDADRCYVARGSQR